MLNTWELVEVILFINNFFYLFLQKILVPKKTRGPTYMARVWVRRGRKEVEFNELGQAIGPNKSEYVEFIGTLVRNGKLLPRNLKDWHNVPKPLKVGEVL